MNNKMTEEDNKIIYKRIFKNLAKTPYIIINISKVKNGNALIEIGKKDHMNKSQAPKWFQDFEKRNDKRWEEQVEFNKNQTEFNKNQTEFNKNQTEFNKNQTEFNKYIIHRLDGIDSRLDNVEKDVVVIKKDINLMKNTPTMKKELQA